MLRCVTVVLASCALLAVAVVPSASAKRKTCSGTVTFSGVSTKIVTYRGVTCTKAKSVLKAYDKGSAPSPWVCVLAHAPFTKIDGRKVGLSCGYGGTGDVRKLKHAFVGTIK